MERLVQNYAHDQKTELRQTAANMSLGTNDMLVLSTLDNVRRNYLDDAVGAIPIAMWELAEMTCLSASELKTAMRHLVDKRLVLRRQQQKRKGCPADTLLLPLADVVLGNAAMQEHLDKVPELLQGLLWYEDPRVITGVCLAWAAGEMPGLDVERDWMAGAEGWSRVVAILHVRMDEVHGALLAAVDETDHAAEAEARGDVEIPLFDGTTYMLDGQALAAYAPNVDAAHVREVMLRIGGKGVRITKSNVCRLAAQAAYSRSRGFVADKPWQDSVNILAAVMTRRTWSEPHGIVTTDYEAIERVGRVC